MFLDPSFGLCVGLTINKAQEDFTDYGFGQLKWS